MSQPYHFWMEHVKTQLGEELYAKTPESVWTDFWRTGWTSGAAVQYARAVHNSEQRKREQEAGDAVL